MRRQTLFPGSAAIGHPVFIGTATAKCREMKNARSRQLLTKLTPKAGRVAFGGLPTTRISGEKCCPTAWTSLTPTSLLIYGTSLNRISTEAVCNSFMAFQVPIHPFQSLRPHLFRMDG